MRGNANDSSGGRGAGGGAAGTIANNAKGPREAFSGITLCV